jgi:hypothetical protein
LKFSFPASADPGQPLVSRAELVQVESASPFDKLTLRQAQGEVCFLFLMLSLSKHEKQGPISHDRIPL